MVLLTLDRPVWVIKLYTLTSGLFMPFLAASLLWLTTKRSLMGELRTGKLSMTAMVAALALFVAIAVRQIVDLLG